MPCFVDDPNFPELNQVLQEIGDKYNVPKTAVAIAWIRTPLNSSYQFGSRKKRGAGFLRRLTGGTNRRYNHSKMLRDGLFRALETRIALPPA